MGYPHYNNEADGYKPGNLTKPLLGLPVFAWMSVGTLALGALMVYLFYHSGQTKLVITYLSLAVIAGILILKPSTAADTASLPPAGTQGGTAQTPGTGTGTGTGQTMPPATQSGPFDPAKATKVPAGQKPEEFVEGYFKAITTGKYGDAFKMLPAEKQAAQTEQQFADQLKGYGMTGYTMGKSATNGDEVSVEASVKTGSGSFGYTWTLVKYNGGYVVKSRTLTGMGQ
jgi:hypothetical protein